MKKILFILLFFAGVAALHSCKIDDYGAPSAVLQGTILDDKGQGLQAEQGQGNTRIRMEELSWSSTPTPMFLNIKQDGNYINSKLFAGKYRISPIEGPFYPVTAEEIDVKGTTIHDFHVLPYVVVEWVGDLVVTADKKISAKFKFNRNEAPAGQTKPTVADYRLFVSTTKYVGNNNFDPANGLVTVIPNENTEVTVTTNTAMKYATTYYVRVGVRVNDNFKKYNYTTVKEITITP
ncbi:DUF3823 domain-containing protein [Pedobacter sp. V48]|uniref:DUF3823 domain-containing protein n=1 Tax=Pedobacter sp. V48 TaxID=509635 RepID=UPI0003E59551|nr:DUF3823 domain-containing protein [Pedobacter sp. V48]ETZ20253.1 hypothetical protein N824_08555 [Pedobacter sp. V48]